MAAEWVPAQISPDPQGGRMLDTAQGILMGSRRCRSEAAFEELLLAAQRHRVPISAMAWGLVHLTCGGDRSPETCNAAESAARHERGPVARPARGVALLRAARASTLSTLVAGQLGWALC